MKFTSWVESFLVVLLLASFVCGQDAQSDSESVDDPTIAAIEETLTVQATAWNNEDLDRFMETYWKSEELTFSAGGNTTRGWQETLDRYKKGYPSGKMGQLTFDHLETTVLGAEAALVLGQWHLEFPDKNKDGNFSLVLRKLDGKWKIVHDHSSLLKPAEDE